MSPLEIAEKKTQVTLGGPGGKDQPDQNFCNVIQVRRASRNRKSITTATGSWQAEFGQCRWEELFSRGKQPGVDGWRRSSRDQRKSLAATTAELRLPPAMAPRCAILIHPARFRVLDVPESTSAKVHRRPLRGTGRGRLH